VGARRTPVAEVTPDALLLDRIEAAVASGRTRRGLPMDGFEWGYRVLAAHRYRPAAPSDGFGHITVPEEALDLDAEARRCALECHAQDDAHVRHTGSLDGRFTTAAVPAIEAVRLLCAGQFDDPTLVP
jgi:hypothetical protein